LQRLGTCQHTTLITDDIHFPFLVNKTNSCTEIQFYWCYDSTCFGQPFCPSSGVLTRTSALIHLMQFDDRLPPGAGWHSVPSCSWWQTVITTAIKCTKADVRVRTPDDGQEGCPKHVESNTNKTGFQYICWFYSQGICYDAPSYDLEVHFPVWFRTNNPSKPTR